ncbi:unnamed protein product [Lampetra planeri]
MSLAGPRERYARPIINIHCISDVSQAERRSLRAKWEIEAEEKAIKGEERGAAAAAGGCGGRDGRTGRRG